MQRVPLWIDPDSGDDRMLPDLEYAALRFETFADEVLRPLATGSFES